MIARCTTVLSFILSIAATPVASAGSDAPETIDECRQIENDERRLNCYDSMIDANAETKTGKFEQLFGEAKMSRVPDERRYTISEVSSRNGVTLVTMANGEIWRLRDKLPNRKFAMAAGDEVTVYSGVFSSYYLRKGDQKIKLRVSREK